MKAFLSETAAFLALIAFMVGLYLTWTGISDADVIALKTHVTWGDTQ